ncbi:hypothetical protein HK098_005645 [Nowakowskiella sp. JEL0407]|nr:hypothetical protein HK098_005645 [Nowakowskiella sp. JEL0407]
MSMRFIARTISTSTFHVKNMRRITLLSIVLLFLPTLFAVPLTFSLHPRAQSCFSTLVWEQNEKVEFYFAVQSGGDFDIDYEIFDPDNKIIYQESKVRQTNFIFAAKKGGEYTFCFSNGLSSFAEKVIDFDIVTQRELNKEHKANVFTGSREQQDRAKEMVKNIQSSLHEVNSWSGGLARRQSAFHTKYARHFTLVKSTEDLIFYLSLVECGLIVVVALVQVQSGGNFDIDYDVRDADGHEIQSGVRERQTDFVFAAKKPGEYTFCFSNAMSSFAEKVIDFDIAAQHEVEKSGSVLKNTITGTSEQKERAQAMVKSITEQLWQVNGWETGLRKMQHLTHTRTQRNFETVQSTETSLFWYSLVECILIVVFAVTQVFLIQMFFDKNQKIRI